MTVHLQNQMPPDEEAALVDRARQGDGKAFTSLLDPWRKPLFGAIQELDFRHSNSCASTICAIESAGAWKHNC